MSVIVHSQAKPLGRNARENFSSGILEMLERFSIRVYRVRVVFRDLNGPKGGIDKECALYISLVREGTVVVKSRAVSIGKAFSDALDRLKVVLQRRSSKRSRRRRSVIHEEIIDELP